jgi:hypothetical protein
MAEHINVSGFYEKCKRRYNTKYKVEEITLVEDNAKKTLKNRRNW